MKKSFAGSCYILSPPCLPDSQLIVFDERFSEISGCNQNKLFRNLLTDHLISMMKYK